VAKAWRSDWKETFLVIVALRAAILKIFSAVEAASGFCLVWP
jgi:hypothetical protein